MESAQKSRLKGKDRLTTVKWFFQASSGMFLVFFMAVHLYVAHINGGSPIELFDSIVRNLSNPWWLAFFIVFVWVITYHALNGVKGIVYDMGVGRNMKKYVSYTFTGIYLATVVYGTILSIIVASTVSG